MEETQTTFVGDTLRRAAVDLHLELSGTRIRAGLAAALRDAVRSGRLAPGSRLPSSRALAADLGIARSTVTECYSDLVAEGWLVAQRGSGTRVAERVPARRDPSGPAPRRRAEVLRPGAADFAGFPRTAWLAAARRALSAAPHNAFGYGDPLGQMELRSALAEYLARARGVDAEPERIIVCSGFHDGLRLVAQALAATGVGTVAVEEYGLGIYRGVLGDAGMRLPALPVDDDGADVHALSLDDAIGAVLLTPAHQFPTGAALSSERRGAALDWARATGGVILEDDYDGEFRYDRAPVGALQGVDPEHVAYFGTTSKSLAPALRLAWVVVPPRLMPAVAAAKGRVDSVSVLDQLTFADFLRSGGFDRHVRGRRQTYKRRRDDLVAAVAQRSPDVTVTGIAAGLQAVIELPEGSEAWVLQAAARQGLGVSGLAEYRHPDAAGPAGAAGKDALVVNFSAVSDSAWPGALAALCAILP